MVRGRAEEGPGVYTPTRGECPGGIPTTPNAQHASAGRTTDSDLDFACTIQSLSSEQLVLYTHDTEASISHEEFEQTETYKRVK